MKSNPLATRYVAPGKLAWRDTPGRSLTELAARFSDQLSCRAAIVGPHGSGKSTLLENLVPVLGVVALRAATYEQAFSTSENSRPLAASAGAVVPQSSAQGRRIVWLKMRGRIQSRRLLLRTYRSWACRDCTLVIDGYEQLSPVARSAALVLTRISRTGILVTSHRTTVLPTLVTTRVDVELAQELLDELLPEDLVDRAQFLEADRLRRLLDKHHGNLREVFMELYDEFVEA